MWRAYRNKYGSLHLGMRSEQSAAMLAAVYANSNSKKTFHMYDFSPHTEGPKEVELPIDQIAKAF